MVSSIFPISLRMRDGANYILNWLKQSWKWAWRAKNKRSGSLKTCRYLNIVKYPVI